MISAFTKRSSMILAICALFMALTFSAVHAADVETVTGVVVVNQQVVVLDTEMGEITVKNSDAASKLSEMDGSTVTVEGVVTETPSGGLEIEVTQIME